MSEVIPLREYIEAHWTAHDRVHVEEERARGFSYDTVQKRLAALNELRAEVTEDRRDYMRLDIANQAHDLIASRMDRIQTQANEMSQLVLSHAQLATHPGTAARIADQEARVRSLEAWRSRAVGVGIVVVLVAGTIGAAIAKVFGL